MNRVSLNRSLLIAAICVATMSGSAVRSPLAAQAAASATGSVVTTRRVWAGDDVDFFGAPSPDGRLLSFIDWRTADLAVRDLAAGQNRTLTRRVGTRGGAWHSAFSPDGKRIVFGWMDSTGRYELRLIDADGSNQRVLEANKSGYLGRPRWSPSGRDIAVSNFRADGVWEIAILSVESGVHRSIKTLDHWEGAQDLAWSPDGRFIAYDFPRNDNAKSNKIHIVGADGRGETALTNDAANDAVVGWAPAGDQLLFFSDRKGTPGLWGLSVVDGKAVGEPRLVRGDLWQSQQIGTSSQGLFYGVTADYPSVFAATIDMTRAQVAVAPTRLRSREVPASSADWSPDGRSIAFTITPSLTTIGIRNVKTGDVRVIQTSLDKAQSIVRWTSDGKSLLVTGRQQSEAGLFRIDLRTEKAERVLSAPTGTVLSAPAISRDGGTWYYTRWTWATGERTLLARNMKTGAETVVACCGVAQAALSPDNASLALLVTEVKTGNVAQASSIQIIPTTGGDGRVVRKLPTPGLVFHDLAWSKDGGQLLFMEGADLMVMSATGGEPRKILTQAARSFRLHPDGRQLLFIGGAYKREAWVMNDIPAAPPVKTSLRDRLRFHN